jgi:hypothetical protein
MQAFLNDPNAWVTLGIGVIVGAVPSWAITRHYAAKTPQWAIEMREEFRAGQDVDFVKTFEDALKDKDIILDEGTF